MNLFFEESGDFKTGAVLSHAGESYQVELPGGKRTKVRARDVLLQYANQTPEHLLEDARAVADEIDRAADSGFVCGIIVFGGI